MKIQGIYKIINRINNKAYIGQSIDIGKRFKEHKYSAFNNKINYPLYNAIRKYGVDNFEFIIIEEVISIQNLDSREQYWLDHYKSYDREHGYNICKEASSIRGHKHTEETKNKISIANKGHIVSEETKRKIGLANKGRIPNRKGYKHSEETRKKISVANKGRVFSEEHRLKLLESVKGKKWSEERKKNLSNLRKGIPSGMLGKKHSEETRKKMVENAKLGKNTGIFKKGHKCWNTKKETNLNSIIQFKQAI